MTGRGGRQRSSGERVAATPHKQVAETRGGVAPVGHPEPLRTIVAGGHPHYVFPTSFDELVRITGGTPADVGA